MKMSEKQKGKQEVVKICPSSESLKDVQSNLKCPILNCDQNLPNVGALRWHLTKTHGVAEANSKKTNEEKTTDCRYVEYHCPVSSCIYNTNSERHFSNINLLRQHYRKVHAEKKYKCNKCGNGFGMEKDCRRHQDRCGIIYKCGTCQCPYTTVEAVMTHCTRKQHQLPEEVINATKERQRKQAEKKQLNKKVRSMNFAGNDAARPNIIVLNVQCAPVVDTSTPNIPQYKPIYPKPVPLNVRFVPSKPQTIIKPASSKENSIQPAENDLVGMSPVKSNASLFHVTTPKSVDTQSQGIQTSNLLNVDKLSKIQADVCNMGIQTSVTIPLHKKKPRTATHTQTASGDIILQTAMATAKIPIQKMSIGTQMTPRSKGKRRKSVCSSETQTSEVVPTKRKRRRRLPGQKAPPRIDSTSQTNDNQKVVSATKSFASRVDSMCQTSGDQRATYGIVNDFTCQTGHTNMISTFVQTNQMIDGISQTHSLQKSITDSSTSCDHSVPTISQLDNGTSNIFQTNPVQQGQTFSVTHSLTSNSDVQTSSFDSSNMSGNTTSSRIIGLVTTIESDEYLGKILSARPVSEVHNIPRNGPGLNTSTITGPFHNESIGVPNSLTFTPVSQSWISASFEQNVSSVINDRTINCHATGNTSGQPSNVHDIDLQTTHSHEQNDVLPSQDSHVRGSSNADGLTQSIGLSRSAVNILDSECQAKEKRSCSASTNTFSSIFDNQRFASFADSEVQTLSSASDIDFLLGDNTGNIPSVDMHTQTVNDVDMLDFLMNDIETQTMDTQTHNGNFSLINIQTQTGNTDSLHSDGFPFNRIQADKANSQTNNKSSAIVRSLSYNNIGSQVVQAIDTQTTTDFDLNDFSLTNIQTQTVLALDEFDECLITTATQTNQETTRDLRQDVQLSAGTQCATDLADMQTQTPFPGLLSFPMTNTYTQTMEDLVNIFAEFDN